jgi:hypothetical protein
MNSQSNTYKGRLEQAGIPGNLPLEELRQRVAAFDDRISSLRADQEATLRNLQTDQKRSASLSLESRCPLCLQPLNDEYKDGLMQRIQDENAERQKSIAQLQGELEEALGACDIATSLDPEYAEAWNFGPPDEDLRTVEWIVKSLYSKWGKNTEYEIDPKDNPHESHILKLDCSKSRMKLGWRPRWNIEKAIDSIIDWTKSFSKKRGFKRSIV